MGFLLPKKKTEKEKEKKKTKLLFLLFFSFTHFTSSGSTGCVNLGAIIYVCWYLSAERRNYVMSRQQPEEGEGQQEKASKLKFTEETSPLLINKTFDTPPPPKPTPTAK